MTKTWTTVERPILFRPELVSEILKGRKWQTRRVMRPQPTKIKHFGLPGLDWKHARWAVEDRPAFVTPYGMPGDRLWVRETWGLHDTEPSDGPERAKVYYRATDGVDYGCRHQRWRPSIFMPRWACRLELGVTKIRVEQIQDITWQDIRAEGIPCPLHDFDSGFCKGECPDLRGGFAHGWTKINGKRGFGWDANPWVWVVDFEPLNRTEH